MAVLLYRTWYASFAESKLFAVHQRVLPKLKYGRSLGTGEGSRGRGGKLGVWHALRLIVMPSRCDGCSCTAVAKGCFRPAFSLGVRFVSVYTEKFTLHFFLLLEALRV